MQTHIVSSPNASLEIKIEVLQMGSGPLVVCLPGAGRPASDFYDLAVQLADHGYCAVAVNPRGIGNSTSLSSIGEQGFSFSDYQQDILSVIHHFNPNQSTTLIGHALGQRMARYIATQQPALIDSVVMLAPGSKEPSGTAEFARFFQCLARDLATEPTDEQEQETQRAEFLESLRVSMFAEGNDARCWQKGWTAAAAFAQGAAVQSMELANYWHAGKANLLALSGEKDIAAGQDITAELTKDFADRIEIHRIADAGHALLPEQPIAIAEKLVQWLNRLQG